MYILKYVAAMALSLFIVSGAQAAHGADSNGEANIWPCPSGKTIMAGDLRTPEDARAFARCAKAFIQAHNKSYTTLAQFREAFDAPQWRDHASSTYVFVDQNTDGNLNGGPAQSQIYPPDPDNGTNYEGGNWGVLIDGLGNKYFKDVYHIVSRWVFAPGEGFAYYRWDKSEGGIKEPKTSYVIRLSEDDFTAGTPPPATSSSHNPYRNAATNPDGHGFVVGAGVYPPELQQSSEGCNAAGLAREATPRKLQDFVRCAAREYVELPKEKTTVASIISGPFFQANLRSGSVYTFVVGVDDGKLDWSAMNSPASGQGVQNALDPEWVNAGAGMGVPSSRDAVKVARDVGESFLYYRHTNPHTGRPARKVTFLKLISHGGGEVLLGSGYYLPDTGSLEPAAALEDYDCDAPRVRDVKAGAVETRDDVQAFVMKARCHIMDVGISQARKDFANPKPFHRTDGNNKESEWYSQNNNMYLFVDDHKADGNDARLHIYPRDPWGHDDSSEAQGFKGEGTAYGNFNDKHGNPYYPEVFRVQDLMGQGWAYYSFTRPEDKGTAWKASYIARFSIGEKKYRIGAGIYEASAPGGCDGVTAERLKELQDDARAEFMNRQGTSMMGAAMAAQSSSNDDGDDDDEASATSSSPSSNRRWINGQLVSGVNLYGSRARDHATRELQAFVRCAAREFEAAQDIGAARTILVTGPNPDAPDDNIEDRTAGNGKWRSVKVVTDTKIVKNSQGIRITIRPEVGNQSCDLNRDGDSNDDGDGGVTKAQVAAAYGVSEEQIVVAPGQRYAHNPTPPEVPVNGPWPEGWVACSTEEIISYHHEKTSVTVDGQWHRRPIYTFVYDEDGKVVWGRDAAQHQRHRIFEREEDKLEAAYERADKDYKSCVDTFPRIHNWRCASKETARIQAEEHLASHRSRRARERAEFEYGAEQVDAAGVRGARVGPRGQNTLKVLDSFGEAFVYYRTEDYEAINRFSGETDALQFPPRSNFLTPPRITTHDVNKRSFMKKVRLGGKVYYIGAGLYE